MKVTVIGLGPGGGADLTGRAREALAACDLIVGYTAYIELVKKDFPEISGVQLSTQPVILFLFFPFFD